MYPEIFHPVYTLLVFAGIHIIESVGDNSWKCSTGCVDNPVKNHTILNIFLMHINSINRMSFSSIYLTIILVL